MIEISESLIVELLSQASENPRLRQNYDLRTSAEDSSQHMLNAMLPGTSIPIHRHPNSSEDVICLCGRFDEVFYNDECVEIARYHICPSEGKMGCRVPPGVWHTLEVIEPSVIYEAKDGRYGYDGSETFDECKK